MSLISEEKWDMKLCNTCGTDKDYSEFGKRKYKSGNYGLTNECKQCKSIKASKKYSSESKEDRERRVSLRKKWLESNRDIVNGLKRKYRLQKKVLKLSSIPHDQHVKEYHSYMFKQSLIRHDNHVREWKADKAGYLKWKYKHDPKYMLYIRLKRGIQRGFKHKELKDGWFDRLGYTMDDLVKHIEKQFVDGMGWHNYQKWHIDHIIPIKSFNMISIEDQSFAACYSLHNLRPIWAEDNMIKYHKVDKCLIINKKGTGSIFFSQG